MRHAGIFRWACAGVIAFVYAIAHAQSAGWKPEFVAPPAGAAAQTAPLRIHVANIPADVPQHLAVELDGIDVSSLAVLDGSDIVITPAQPIAFGRHTLRLVENTPDGGIVERGRWNFELRESAAFREAHLQANVTLNASQRVADHNVVSAPGPLQVNGAAQIQGTAENETWRASGTMSLIANSQASQTPTKDRKVDVGQYLLSAQKGAVTASMGDHAALGPDSLVMQGFARRGISVKGVVGGVAQVTGFSMSAAPAIGSHNFSGVQDSQNRIDGMVATLFPVSGSPDELALSATYVDGRSANTNGAATAGVTQPSSGHAASFVADSQVLDKRLRLRGEIASSNYDFDGADGPLQPKPGHAYSGLVNYLPWHSKTVLGEPLMWNVGAQKERLSTYFQSIANPGAIADRDMGQLFTGVDWYGLNVQVAAAKEHDNVDDIALLPRTESTQHSIALGYSPLQTPDASGALPPAPWYGQPSFSAAYTKLSKSLTRVPANLSPTLEAGPLHETTNLQLSAQFQHETWSWGLGHSRLKDEDYANLAPDTLTKSDRLDAALQMTKLSVSASVQHDLTDDQTNGTRTQDVAGNATLTYPFTDRISSNLGYSVQHAWADTPASDQVISDTTIGLNWLAVPADGQHPGLSLGLDGSYHTCKDKLAVPTSPNMGCLDSYQVFLRMSVSWSPSF